jgi:hypothetical protein
VTGCLGDQVWIDRDADGVIDADEVGIPGANVVLTRPGGSTISMVTDSAGKYLFCGLGAGTYRVTVTVPDAAYVATYDLDGGKDSTAQASLTAGQTRLDVDFGYNRPTEVQDTTVSRAPEVSELSFTGSAAGRMAITGGTLLVIGGLVLLIGRLRRRPEGGSPLS